MSAVVKWTFEDYWRGVEQTVKFVESGLVQQWVVPDTVSQVFIEMRGGIGGGSHSDGLRTSGGYVSGWLQVTPGETLNIRVGGEGGVPTDYHGAAGGWNGGGVGGDVNNLNNQLGGYGGGGATDVRQGGDALSNRVAVAAGSGGTSGFGHHAGAGGPNEGQPGWSQRSTTEGGGGGTQSAGGYGGPGISGTDASPGGSPGDLGVGGAGAANPYTHYHSGAGGGGAGYYGGGGGGLDYEQPPVTMSTSDANAMLLREVSNHLIMAFGGGGGSNYVGGFDQSQPIANQRGARFNTLSTKPQSFVKISYQQESFSYMMEINPNDGGSPAIQKNVQMSQTSGPNRVNILQEGQSQAPLMAFSGIILDQDQLEAMEMWYDRRVFIKITDDLKREFYGVFSKFTPKRQRRASNFWYHQYDAEFTLAAYKNASGNWVYGRVA